MEITPLLDHNVILANLAQPVNFALRLKAAEIDSQRERPLAFCLVLDRSGSMSGAPLDQAKEAAARVVKNLRPGDQFALVTFDDTAETLVPLQVARDKAGLRRRIDAIQPGGSTNLTGGWMLGRDQLRTAPADYARRLLLLSDGHLNHGITEPEQVRVVVAGGLEHDRIRTSCLGFGGGYDEDLMGELARCTNGQFYDATSAEKLPAIFAAELDGLQKLSAQNIRVRVRPLPFCEQLEPLGDNPCVELPDGRTEYALGDLVSGEEQIACWAMEVLPLPCIDGQPVASLEGEPLLEIEVLYDEVTASGIESHTFEQTVRVQATQDPGRIQRNGQVLQWVSLQRTGKVMDEVTRHMDQGNLPGALELLDAALVKLAEYPDVQGIQEAAQPLERLRDQLKSDRYDARSRKHSRYSARTYRKMKSMELWSLEEASPSFKQPPSDKR